MPGDAGDSGREGGRGLGQGAGNRPHAGATGRREGRQEKSARRTGERHVGRSQRHKGSWLRGLFSFALMRGRSREAPRCGQVPHGRSLWRDGSGDGWGDAGPCRTAVPFPARPDLRDVTEAVPAQLAPGGGTQRGAQVSRIHRRFASKCKSSPAERRVASFSFLPLHATECRPLIMCLTSKPEEEPSIEGQQSRAVNGAARLSRSDTAAHGTGCLPPPPLALPGPQQPPLPAGLCCAALGSGRGAGALGVR